MIDIQQAGFGWTVARVPLSEARHEYTTIVFPLDKKMDRIAIRVDTAHDYLPVVI